MRAWLFQDKRRLAKAVAQGESCAWSVGWIDPSGHERRKTIGSKTASERFARKTEGELAAGLYRNESRQTWAQFIERYSAAKVAGFSHAHAVAARTALGHFTRLMSPGRLDSINSETIDLYVAKRRREKVKRIDRLVSVALLNKELRYLKAALRKAAKWDLIVRVPEIEMLREPERDPIPMPVDVFLALVAACDKVADPNQGNWWRGLLWLLALTGARIGETLSIRWADVDLVEGIASFKADSTKGKRDRRFALHPKAIEHLKPLTGFGGALVFPWSRRLRDLYTAFHELQALAEIGSDPHGKPWGFHSLRRSFATWNADRMPQDDLRVAMGHASYATTAKHYVGRADRLHGIALKVFVPEGRPAHAG